MTHLAYVAVISAGRSGNVPKMMDHGLADVGPVTWFVPPGQGPDYGYAGAEHVVEADGLCGARNAALVRQGTEHPTLPCLQLSDDLKGVRLANGTKRENTRAVSVREAVALMDQVRRDTGAQLVGVAPTANPFYSRQRVHSTGFVVGDMVLVGPACPVMWDEGIPVKEDYDYTLRHLERYGQVARCDWILADFAHRTNKGGAVATRKADPTVEDVAIARLLERWPEHIKLNPRREREVLLRWKPPSP